MATPVKTVTRSTTNIKTTAIKTATASIQTATASIRHRTHLTDGAPLNVRTHFLYSKEDSRRKRYMLYDDVKNNATL